MVNNITNYNNMNHISVKPQAIIINGQQYNHYNNMNHISVNTQTIIINGQQYMTTTL